jgi:hypothetical protein
MRDTLLHPVKKTAGAIDDLLSLPYEKLSLVWVSATLLFACAYYILSFVPGQGPTGAFSHTDSLYRFLDLLYFSIITGTSTGFGDIVPQGFSRIFSALQAISSVVIIALFVAKFVARKQEVALDNIHLLSFDAAFHNIRQGLFIARKDLDVIMRKVILKEELTRKDWRNIYISFHQVQIFLRQIPALYATEHQSLALEVDKERLLLDAVERSLRRITEALSAFKDEKISLKHETGALKELRDIVHLTEKVLGEQRDKTVDVENKEAFQEVMERAYEIRDAIV